LVDKTGETGALKSANGLGGRFKEALREALVEAEAAGGGKEDCAVLLGECGKDCLLLPRAGFGDLGKAHCPAGALLGSTSSVGAQRILPVLLCLDRRLLCVCTTLAVAAEDMKTEVEREEERLCA